MEPDKLSISNKKSIDEFNFSSFFNEFWKGKYIILSTLLLSFLLALIYLSQATYTYEIKLKVIPTSLMDTSVSNVSQFSGIADIIGLNVPKSGGENKFNLYTSLLKSNVIAEKIALDTNLMKKLFAANWDDKSKSWIKPKTSSLKKITNYFYNLIGIPVNYPETPNKSNVLSFLKSNVIIYSDPISSITEISLDTTDKELGVLILNTIHLESDNILKKRSFHRASKHIDFLQKQLLNSTRADERLSLIQTLAEQNTIQMNAVGDLPFVSEIFSGPLASKHFTKPNAKTLMVSSLIFGLLFGCLIILIKNYRSF
ncbi:MAG: hypothetical protein CMP38_02780 [Rickettsiales bacterium]|nr:hypothetical protein [Rickettsiales bacterium]|tara:strand:+ start:2078 stop:3016 length:939 start_codon:yes stop_codon:yes gene_type:complete